MIVPFSQLRDRIVRILVCNGEYVCGQVTGYVSPEDNALSEESILVQAALGEIAEFYRADIHELEILA